MTQNSAPKLLDPFLSPDSIAIIGLSRSAIGSPVSVHTTLNEMGYGGRTFIVNPGMDTAPNATVCRSIPDLPEAVDLAIISVERKMVPDTLEACADRGIRSAVIITQGFADADEVGAGLQRQIDAIIARRGIRVLGPNTIGLVNSPAKFTSSFIEVTPDNLPVGQVSQSGFLMMGHHLVTNEPAGYCTSVDLGNGCDINLIDVLEHYRTDPNITTIEIHAEAIEDGRAFMETASRISRSKPIVALKAGRTEAGQAAAASHTGAVAGQVRVTDAALRQAGVFQAENAEELRMLSKSFATFGEMKGKRVAIMSYSGGGAVLAIDALDRAGLQLAELSGETKRTVKRLFPDWMHVENPLDIWMPVAKDLDDAFPLVMNALLQDDGVDAVICIYCSYNLPKYDRFDASGYIRDLSAASRSKPVACWSYGQDIEGFTRTIEEKRSAIVYPRLDDAARSLAALACHTKRKKAKAKAEDDVPVSDPSARRKSAAVLKKAAADGQDYLFTEAFDILKAYDLPLVNWAVVRSEAELEAATRDLTAPLCLKIDSPDVIHKSDSGGVALGVGKGDELTHAYRGMNTTVARNVPGARLGSVVVQEMAPKGTEVMIGMVRDPSFGPCVVFGTGGVYAEILDDFAFRIAPVTTQDARDMIDETIISRILSGARGQKAADVDALVDVIVKVSQIATAHPEINEIDLNPVFATPTGAHLLDARFMLAGQGTAAKPAAKQIEQAVT
ncbi:acetate--CoA ligase family protein [Leisingera daeponensis]|uniref:acetate--CoA ligase family protein n=1 Tax=Leisingera daeponensis TaxID=405746 RepID=UPI001C958EE2|nr:acetate--CoA ligase family protein [Leisingera daeponensis]MBY6058773.1 acetate--CoA ligase family protein [Leisingera daeponensis]